LNIRLRCAGNKFLEFASRKCSLDALRHVVSSLPDAASDSAALGETSLATLRHVGNVLFDVISRKVSVAVLRHVDRLLLGVLRDAGTEVDDGKIIIQKEDLA